MDTMDLPWKSIQEHYDACSRWYAHLWGEHLHHGYWERNETPEEAQVRLIERLAQSAGIEGGERVLDAGCGLGGSSVWLAQQRGCRVTGVTLSPVQARRAVKRVENAGLDSLATILTGDLEVLSLPRERFDVVWSIECTEHFWNKEGFIRRAARWLKPGGRLAICAWTKSDDLSEDARQQYIRPICEGFLCPSLGSAAEYAGWMEAAGLTILENRDITSHTAKTWEVCLQRTTKRWIRWLAWWLGPATVRFLNSFSLIWEAYRVGALRYTIIIATKPLESTAG